MSYSILSLDGGGSWALIQVKILQQRYGMDAGGHEILRKYDLVIANSGELSTRCDVRGQKVK